MEHLRSLQFGGSPCQHPTAIASLALLFATRRRGSLTKRIQQWSHILFFFFTLPCQWAKHNWAGPNSSLDTQKLRVLPSSVYPTRTHFLILASSVINSHPLLFAFFISFHKLFLFWKKKVPACSIIFHKEAIHSHVWSCLIIIVAPLWTFSRSKITFLRWKHQNSTQYSRWEQTSVLYIGIIIFSVLFFFPFLTVPNIGIFELLPCTELVFLWSYLS